VLSALCGEPSFKSNLFLVGLSAEGSLFFIMQQQKGYVFSLLKKMPDAILSK